MDRIHANQGIGDIGSSSIKMGHAESCRRGGNVLAEVPRQHQPLTANLASCPSDG
jgi:hypothetical protein